MTKICRLCLVRLSTGSEYFPLNDTQCNSRLKSFREQLNFCVPELALDLTANPVICNVCRQTLHLTYEFKKRCLQNEEKIKLLLAGNLKGQDCDLSSLATFDSCITFNSLSCDLLNKNDVKPIIKKKPSVEIRKVEPPVTTTKLVTPKPTGGAASYLCNFCGANFDTLQMLRKHNMHCKASKGDNTRRPLLPKSAKNHMKRWLFLHSMHPYPTDQEKQQLMKETGLSLLQVENWFINARRRILQDLARLKNRAPNNAESTPPEQIKNEPLDLEDDYIAVKEEVVEIL